MSNTNNFDLITAKVIAAMSNPGEWVKSRKHFANYSAAGRAYSGINVFSLGLTAMMQGYDIPLWGTYNQLQSVGLQVRKGQKSTVVVYWGFVSEPGKDREGNEVEHKRPILRSYAVFNIGQCDEVLPGVKDRLKRAIYKDVNAEEKHAQAESFVQKTGVPIGVGEPAYSRSNHKVYMPAFERFESAEAYYATLFHELVHSTCTELEREKHALWGDSTYAAEELVAELGAAMLCAYFGLSAEPRADHASYLTHWVKMLTDSNRAIMTAATKAQQAVNLLLTRAGYIKTESAE